MSCTKPSPLQACLRTAFYTLTLIALPACLLTTAAYLSADSSILAQASPFRLQYAVLLGGHALFCLSLRRWLAAVCFALFALFNVFAILSTGITDQTASTSSPDEPTLSLIYANVHAENTDAAPLLALIRAESPDLIALNEINHRWSQDLLTSLSGEYPYHFIREREDNFGVALFSKQLLSKTEIEFFSAAEVPSLTVTLHVASQSVRLLLTHPVPPGNTEGTRQRNDHINALAAWTTASPAPVIIVGDFNATPWCPPLRQLLSNTRLQLATSSRSYYPSTWPVGIPHLQIPIDHVLLDSRMIGGSFRVGPNIGSDHFPLIVSLTLRAAGVASKTP